MKCLEIEEYISGTLLLYIEQNQRVTDIEYMLLEKDFKGRDSLDLLVEFQLFRIIQHRNVQEVIMQIFKSKYAIESYGLDLSTNIRMLQQGKVFSKVDTESFFRFY